MAPNASDYKHLDTAASQLTHILREAGIRHVFFGGFAATLLGSERVTKVKFPSTASPVPCVTRSRRL